MIKVVKTAAVLLLVVVSSGFGIQGTSTGLQEPTRLVNEGGGDWQVVSLENEEFSMATPVQPSVLTRLHIYGSDDGRGNASEERTYSGYSDGFVFALESYKTPGHRKLLKYLVQSYRMQPIKEVNLN